MAIKITAIMLLAVFYVCYFAKLLLQKRKGIRTDQMGRNKQGRERRIELALKCNTILVPLLQTVSVFWPSEVPAVLRILGLLLCAVGDAVFVVSVVTMKDNWRAGVSDTEKTELVTDGIYRFSRNPAFLGFDLTYVGLLLAFFNLPLAVLSLSGMVLFHLQITKVEEPFLRKSFGAPYAAYCERTARYFGARRGR